MIKLNFFPIPTLKTGRLTLRAMSAGDAAALFELRSDPRVNRYIDRLPAKVLMDASQFIEKIQKGIQENHWLYWAISEKADPEQRLIGTLCLWNFVPVEDKAELGYELCSGSQGRGLMGEAVDAIITYGFETLGLACIEAAVHPDNAASIRVLERAGFTPAGTFQDTYLTGETVEMRIFRKSDPLSLKK